MNKTVERKHQLHAMPTAWKKRSNILIVVFLSLFGISIFLFFSPMVLFGLPFSGWGILGHFRTLISFAFPTPFGAMLILKVILGII